MHTRNPFLRHVATDTPTPISPLSPAAIPLPLRTSDEQGQQYVCAGELVALQTMTNVLNYLKVKIDIAQVGLILFWLSFNCSFFSTVNGDLHS